MLLSFGAHLSLAIKTKEDENDARDMSVTGEKNSRWYFNRLDNQDEGQLRGGRGELKRDNIFETPYGKPAAVSRITDNPRSKLKRQVIKRLVDVIFSPTNNEKKIVFRKLVANNGDSQAIVDLVVEMQSSVEETKNMLLNSCA